MAQEWCLFHGVVKSEEHAEKLFKLVSARKGKDLKSPAKKGGVPARNSTPAKKKAPTKKAKYIDEEEDGDAGFEASSAWEQSGKAGV